MDFGLDVSHRPGMTGPVIPRDWFDNWMTQIKPSSRRATNTIR
jgi:hypothetical protein